MRKIALILSIVFAVVYIAGAVPYFKVVDAPTAHLSPNSNTSLPITIQNIGGDGAYARLVFRGLPDGITVSNVTRARWVYPGGRMTFDVNLIAGNISPGNYSSEVGISAKSSPPNYKRFYVVVENITEERSDLEIASEEPLSNASLTENLSRQKQIPAAGFIWAIIAVALSRIKMKKS